MKIKQIINSVYSSNTFILSENHFNQVWLIDIGDIAPIIKTLKPGQSIHGVFLTHTHFDHIYGINKLISLFPDCMVYTSEFGNKGLHSEKLNFSKYHNQPFTFSGNKIQIVKEDDEIEIFPEKKLKIIETQGHDPSCLTFYTDRYIFTGDSYIPGLKVVTTFPKSNKEQAQISIQKILSLNIEDRIICPGHGVIE